MGPEAWEGGTRALGFVVSNRGAGVPPQLSLPLRAPFLDCVSPSKLLRSLLPAPSRRPAPGFPSLRFLGVSVSVHQPHQPGPAMRTSPPPTLHPSQRPHVVNFKAPLTWRYLAALQIHFAKEKAGTIPAYDNLPSHHFPSSHCTPGPESGVLPA